MSTCRNLTLTAAQQACLQDENLTQTPADISRCLGLYEVVESVFQPALRDEIPASGIDLRVNITRNGSSPQASFTASPTDPTQCLTDPRFQNILNSTARANLNRSILAIQAYGLWASDNPRVTPTNQDLTALAWDGFLHRRRDIGAAIPANITAPAQLWATMSLLRYLNQDPAIQSFLPLLSLPAQQAELGAAFNRVTRGFYVFPSQYLPTNGAMGTCAGESLGWGLRAAACVDATSQINNAWDRALRDCEDRRPPESSTPWGWIAAGAAVATGVTVWGGRRWLVARDESVRAEAYQLAREEFRRLLEEGLRTTNLPPPESPEQVDLLALQGRAVVAAARRGEGATEPEAAVAEATATPRAADLSEHSGPELTLSAPEAEPLEPVVPQSELDALNTRFQARLEAVARDFEARLRAMRAETLPEQERARHQEALATVRRESFAEGLRSAQALTENDMTALRLEIDRLAASLRTTNERRAQERRQAARALMGIVHEMNRRLTLERMSNSLAVEALEEAVSIQRTILNLLEGISEISLVQDGTDERLRPPGSAYRDGPHYQVGEVTHQLWAAVGYVNRALTAQEEALAARQGPHTRIRDWAQRATPAYGNPVPTALRTEPDGTPVPPKRTTRPAAAPTHDDAVMVAGAPEVGSALDRLGGVEPAERAEGPIGNGRPVDLRDPADFIEETRRFVEAHVPEGVRRALGEFDPTERRGRR